MKEILQRRCFRVNDAKCLTTHFFTEHLPRLLYVYVGWANIASVNFLCNVVSAVFGQHWLDCWLRVNIVRTSRLQLFFKISVLKNLFHFKTSMVEFLFNKVAALKACNFIKKKLQHKCFLVNIAKFLRTPYKFLVQCCLRRIWTTLSIRFSLPMQCFPSLVETTLYSLFF